MPVPSAPSLRRMATAALLMSVALPAAAQDIRSVTLSTAGIAMIEATGSLGETPLRLALRRADIDDFLKSAWIADPLGAVPQLTLPGDGAFADTFALLPIGPGDVTDPARLLTALAGARVAVERRGSTVEGVNMGVSLRDCGEGNCQILTVLTDAGEIAQFDLAESTARLADPEDQAMLARALAAHRISAGPGLIEVALSSDNPEAREVGLVWLQAAPLWRTAYRAVATPEGLRLSGWAVVENTTGRDWDDVELTLATGSVRALSAQLYERRYVGRDSADDAFPMPAPAPMVFAGSRVGAAAPVVAFEAAPAAVAVEADDGVSFSRFTLTTPVTLAAGEMISLPFLDELLPGAQRLIFRGGLGEVHPVIALELRNPLPLRLPAGVLTLYEEGRGHAGDAAVPELAPQASEVVDFATDRAVGVSETEERIETVRAMSVVRGILTVEEDWRRMTTYRIEGAADAERVIDIEHPLQPGWTLDGPTPDETLLDAYRFRVTVPAGEIVTFEVVEMQPQSRRLALADLNAPMLASWLNAAPEGEARAFLAALVDLRGAQAEVAGQINRIAQREAELVAEQDRLVQLIVALNDDSPATQRRRDRVDAVDGELATLAAEREALRARQETLDAELAVLLGR